jgi:hypothetical protein
MNAEEEKYRIKSDWEYKNKSTSISYLLTTFLNKGDIL